MRKHYRSKAIAVLGGLLSGAVKAREHTVIEIAKRSGVPRSFIYKVIRGSVPGMTLSTAERLCAAIGAAPADLFRERKAAPDAVIIGLARALKWAKGK